MIKILYDHQIFALQQYGGISRYICELAKHVTTDADFIANIVAPLSINNYLHEDSIVFNGFYIPYFRGIGRIIRPVNSVVAPFIVSSLKPDIVHETYYSVCTVAPKGCPIVLTAHDMIHEKYKQFFPPNDHTTEMKRIAFSRADRIICVSENTRQDLIEIFGIAPEKTMVVYHGFSLNGVAKPVDFFNERPFLLYVGARSGYKNFDTLLAAYATSSKLKSEFDLIAFGCGQFTPDENAMIRKLNIDVALVRQISGNDAILSSLYSKAAAFIYPSLYEGFGIPPLEAMSYNCPVVCSNVSSIPEVVGNAACFFNPTDLDSIRMAIEKVVESTELRDNLIKHGRIRLKQFSWDKCASETMQVYKELSG